MRNPENTLGMEKDKNSRGGSVSGSRLNADRNTTESLGIKFHGIPEGEKQPDDL